MKILTSLVVYLQNQRLRGGGVMSAQEAPPANPGKEQTDGRSAPTDGPSPTLAPKTKNSSPPSVTIKKEPGISETSKGKVGDGNPAEICVVIGGHDGGGSVSVNRRPQTEGMFVLGTPPPTKNTDSCIGEHSELRQETEHFTCH